MRIWSAQWCGDAGAVRVEEEVVVHLFEHGEGQDSTIPLGCVGPGLEQGGRPLPPGVTPAGGWWEVSPVYLQYMSCDQGEVVSSKRRRRCFWIVVSTIYAWVFAELVPSPRWTKDIRSQWGPVLVRAAVSIMVMIYVLYLYKSGRRLSLFQVIALVALLSAAVVGCGVDLFESWRFYNS